MPERASSPTLATTSVPVREKAAFSLLAVAQQLGGNGVAAFAFPAYGLILGLSPSIIGGALSSMLVISALTDQWFGWLSDQHTGRWGRRRPFIAAGAVLGGLFFALLWAAQPAWSETLTLCYFVVLLLLVNTASSALVVPGTALGWEMTQDYTERTRVMTWYSISAKVTNLAMPWMFALTQWSGWRSEYNGLQATGMIFGGLFAVTGVISAAFCRERRRLVATREKPPSILVSMQQSATNPTFMLICGMTFITLFGATAYAALGTYLNLYYLFPGDKAAAAQLTGAGGTAATLIGLATVLVINRFFARTDKRRLLIGCMVLALGGWATAYAFITPLYPYLSLIPAALNGTAAAGFWLVILSMIGDATDDDELRTGRRREGVMAAFISFLNKGAMTAGTAAGGFYLTWIGFEPARVHQPPATLSSMLHSFIWLHLISYSVVLLMAWKYPLTQRRVGEIEAELQRRRGEARPA
jgi:glycoside/pentoside/hexuronide:cation symporter, GPH family